ncbi:MAG: rhomboid family intramembrane serine protease [Armatimonadetes bacterium]|nr:rhomboid family intramembrane serine protease [Armatimonadota bacterium]
MADEAPRARRTPFPWATATLVALNAAAFVATLAASGGLQPASDVLAAGWKAGDAIAAGQVWRLWSSCFLHAGIWHVALNLWCLWQLGSIVEVLVGPAWLVAVYGLAGITGALLGAQMSPAPGLGASGAVLGVGALGLAVTRLQARQLNPEFCRQFGRSVLTWLLLTLALGLMIPRVDNYAHLGGMLCGLLLALATPLRHAPWWRHLPAALLALVLVGATVWAGDMTWRGTRPAEHMTRREVPGAGVTLEVPEQWLAAPQADGSMLFSLAGVPAVLTVDRFVPPEPVPREYQSLVVQRSLADQQPLEAPVELRTEAGEPVWYLRAQPGVVLDVYFAFRGREVVRVVGQVAGERARFYQPVFRRAALSLRPIQ